MANRSPAKRRWLLLLITHMVITSGLVSSFLTKNINSQNPSYPPIIIIESLSTTLRVFRPAFQRNLDFDPSREDTDINVTVLGGGNFGLALATVLANQPHVSKVTLLLRSNDISNHINVHHTHPKYFPEIELPPKICATANPRHAFPTNTKCIVQAVPVQFSRKLLQSISYFVPPHIPILSASKGIESDTLSFMDELLSDCLGHDRAYAFLSGPSFAKEVRQGLATAVVVASNDFRVANFFSDLLSSPTFRVFTSKDVMGVELGGAVKNVIALAAGMCEGLGLGTNAMSALVTRGCAELHRLGKALGAKPGTLSGLSGRLTRLLLHVTKPT